MCSNNDSNHHIYETLQNKKLRCVMPGERISELKVKAKQFKDSRRLQGHQLVRENRDNEDHPVQEYSCGRGKQCKGKD